ncbi:MAG: transposase [Deltaproteobacteria bacterium]|nr:transposase [Deltaproteobacteria bacterium]
MAETAAHLVDRVLPEAPIRQWVLTLPYPLRYRCAYDAKLTSEVLRAFLRALFVELRRRARQQWNFRAPQCGAVTFVQRFGSALNLNLHFHTLALDGVYTDSEAQGRRHGSRPCLRPITTKWRGYSQAPLVACNVSWRNARAKTKTASLEMNRCSPYSRRLH